MAIVVKIGPVLSILFVIEIVQWQKPNQVCM